MVIRTIVFPDQSHLNPMNAVPSGKLTDDSTNDNRLLRHREIDQLPVRTGMKRSECRQKINRFKQCCFSLSISPYQQKDFPGNIQIQPGKASEIRE
jgi:hypothetical protein